MILLFQINLLMLQNPYEFFLNSFYVLNFFRNLEKSYEFRMFLKNNFKYTQEFLG